MSLLRSLLMFVVQCSQTLHLEDICFNLFTPKISLATLITINCTTLVMQVLQIFFIGSTNSSLIDNFLYSHNLPNDNLKWGHV